MRKLHIYIYILICYMTWHFSFSQQVAKNEHYEIKVEGNNIISLAKQFVFNGQTDEIIIELSQKTN